MAKRVQLPAVVCGGTTFYGFTCRECGEEQPPAVKTWAQLDRIGMVVAREFCTACAPVIATRERINLERFN